MSRVAFEGDRTDPELVAFFDIDVNDEFIFVVTSVFGVPRRSYSRSFRPVLFNDRFVYLHLNIAFVVIEVPDRFDVLMQFIRPQSAASAKKGKEPVFLRLQCIFDLIGRNSLIAGENDFLKRYLFPFFDIKNDISVAAAKFGDDRHDDGFIIAGILVFQPDLFGIFLISCSVERCPRQQGHTFLQIFSVVSSSLPSKLMSRISGFSLT